MMVTAQYDQAMVTRLSEIRLVSFKSVRNARIALGPLTLVVGRNGSGKSNILDAVSVLSALASGTSLRDALDGGREGPIVRGGSEGCAPVGENSFAIGCSIATDSGPLHLDIEVRTAPTVQITSERLWSLRNDGQKRLWLASDTPSPHSADITARWENRRRGVNPPVTMRADQLLTSQVAVRVPATSQAGREVHERAAHMLSALGEVFLLDPVPHQMREYVPEKDFTLRRGADNLSAVLRRIATSDHERQALLAMTQSLSEAQVANLTSVTSQLGDVMVTLTEHIGGSERAIPARLMSDGTLRFLAIAAAMLDPHQRESHAERLLVVEELENGLHPSQASLLIGRLKDAASDRRVQTLATTHSPVILDSLDGDDHETVVVVTRDKDGWSRVTRLVDFPDYFEVVGPSTLGDRVTDDALRPGTTRDSDVAERSLAEIFGA